MRTASPLQADAPDQPSTFTPFATSADVQKRLGRELTAAESGKFDTLTALASISLLASLGVSTSWQPSGDAALMLNLMAVEIAIRVSSNPQSLAAQSETLGAYSHSETFAMRGALGFGLTPAEELMIRRVVFGSTSASVKVQSQADEYAELIWPDLDLLWATYYGEAGSLIIWK